MNKIKSLFAWLWQKFRAFCTWYKGLYHGRAWYTKTLVALASCIVAFILYLGAVDINFLWLFGKSPGYFSGILDPQTSEASEIYSADGKLIGKYFNENRTPVEYDEVTPDFFKALVDTEDERFYKHIGIDPIGVFAAAKDALLHHNGRGASTITQQLAKNMFRVRSQYSTGLLGKIPVLRLLIIKSKEWIIAVKLETVFSKKEIITMYANTVDFGSNSYGIKTAAKTYFNTTPKELTTGQAAVLVGMLKATTYYNPRTNPENSLARRNTVLYNMVTHGDLSKDRYNELKDEPIKLDFKVEENYDGQAKYFREAIANYLKDWCKDEGYDLYTSGLKIYTTIDTRMQKYAEDAARKQMKQVQQNFNNHWSIRRTQAGKGNWMGQDPWQDENHNVIPNFIQGIAERQPFYKALIARFPNNPDSVNYYYKEWVHPVKVFDYDKGSITMNMTSEDSIKYMTTFMHCAFVAMEPQTGAVKAWVGDIDFDHWEYDKATAERQPGSTFKMFVYAAAMEAGLGPCDDRVDEYRQYDAFDAGHNPIKWAPRNSTGVYTGAPMSLKHAFSNSVNSVAVAVAEEVGMQRVIDVAKRLGIRSPLQNTPALALGSSDVTLLDMVNSYCTIMNGGRRNMPSFVTRIEDKDGNVVYRHEPENKRAVSRETAFLMQQMLLAGMTEPGGTSMALWGYDIHRYDTNFGGKTGTTTDNSDGWYVGVTKNLVAGCWVGGEYRNVHFRSGRMGQGSHTALPVFGRFMEKVLADPSLSRYRGRIPDKPSFEVDRPYDCHTVLPPDTTSVDSLPSAQFAPGIVDVEEESAADEIEKAE